MAKGKNSNPFVGCTIVATGKLENFTRDDINTKIVGIGAIAGNSVTRKTDYVICGKKHTQVKATVFKTTEWKRRIRK